MVSSFKRLSLLALFSWTAFSVQADYKDDIGYTALALQLGANLPTGAGVTVSQIEADENGEAPDFYYMPGPSSDDTITNVSNLSSNVSNHASIVGSYFYGPSSIASGVSSINAYDADDWLNNFLHRGSSSQAPTVEVKDIQNHSWVGSYGVDAADTQVLKRLDFAVQRDNFVSVVGLNNSSTVNNLLSSAYNVISVGEVSGSHSYAPTTIYGAGRQRVHVVANMGATSYSTAVVSSASALLINTARSKSFSNGDDSRTIKAIIMAGATKTDVPSWSYAVHGAGELNIQNSYNIMAAGKQTAAGVSTLAASTGWDFSSINTTTGDQTYRIYVGQNSALSISLAWNALLTGSDYNNLTTSVANLDLKVYFNATNTPTLGALQNSTASGSGGMSTVDNVEHLWWGNLNEGYYSFVISSSSPTLTEYALAWQTVPEPSRALLVLVGFVSVIWVRRRNSVI